MQRRTRSCGDTATATLSGNLTREVEPRPLSSRTRWRCSAWLAGRAGATESNASSTRTGGHRRGQADTDRPRQRPRGRPTPGRTWREREADLPLPPHRQPLDQVRRGAPGAEHCDRLRDAVQDVVGQVAALGPAVKANGPHWQSTALGSPRAPAPGRRLRVRGEMSQRGETPCAAGWARGGMLWLMRKKFPGS